MKPLHTLCGSFNLRRNWNGETQFWLCRTSVWFTVTPDSLLFRGRSNKGGGQVKTRAAQASSVSSQGLQWPCSVEDSPASSPRSNHRISKTNRVEYSVPNSNWLGKLAWHFKTCLLRLKLNYFSLGLTSLSRETTLWIFQFFQEPSGLWLAPVTWPRLPNDKG